MQEVLQFVFIIALFGLLFSYAFVGLSIAPYVPTRKKDFERINRLAGLKPGEKFVELGCGTGRVCGFIARKNPEVEVLGVELSFPVYLLAKAGTFFRRKKNLKIKYGNAYKTDLKSFDVIFVFALPATINRKLKEKFLTELKDESRAISYSFRIKEWPGKETIDKPSKKDLTIYVYKK